MREIRLSGSEGGGTKPIASPYPYFHPSADADDHAPKRLPPHLFSCLALLQNRER